MKRSLPLSIVLMSLTAGLALSADKQPQSGANLGNVKGGDFEQAHGIIDKKCTKCHSKDKIDAARSSGKDMIKIQKEMLKRGATLNANEQEVLGIYWKQTNPLTKK
ncbi:MAG: hypothetical protein WCP20_15630 [Desulfuromonadales bacterium]